MKWKKIKDNASIFKLSCVLFLLYFLPYFIFGENAHLIVLDNLDSNVAWIKVLIDNNALFAEPSRIIPSMLNGISIKNVYPSYNLSLLIFNIFGVYWGYVINKILIGVIGFGGMFLLLQRHVISVKGKDDIAIVVSLIYGLLPFWSFTATVSGLPFVLFAFINLRERIYKWFNWLIILIFAFNSSLVLSGVFLLIVLGLIFLYDFIRYRNLNFYYLLGLALLSVAYCLSHYPAISGFMEEGISHRVEFVKPTISFFKAAKKSILIFVMGQYHAHSLHTLFVLPLIGIITYLKVFDRRTLALCLFLGATSLFYGYIDFELFRPVVDLITEVIPIQIQRFHFLHPVCWYLLLAIGLVKLNSKKSKWSKCVVGSVLVIQLSVVFLNHEVFQSRNGATFRQFYAEATFNKVKEVIGKPVESYKVISVGMHPSIAQFNGLHTLDGYFPSYPLEYKHKFAKVISEEIKRDQSVANYFSNWGSRCYAFSAELGKNYLALNRNSIDTLNFNYQALRDLGGEFILSSVPINETINEEVVLVKEIEKVEGDGGIFVYKVVVGN